MYSYFYRLSEVDFFSELIAIRVSKISTVFLSKLVILGGNSEILQIGRNEGPDKRCAVWLGGNFYFYVFMDISYAKDVQIQPQKAF